MQLPVHRSLALALLAVPGLAQEAPAPGDTALERRANVFTTSTQDDAALALCPNGETVVTWQSRRQQDGSYGVYARRFGSDRAPRGGEVQINLSTHGMQRNPAVAASPDGALWFSWMSFGRDADQGTIVARLFSPELETATREVVVNRTKLGHQSDPSIAALPNGGAIVVWSSSHPRTKASSVHARLLSANGEIAGDEFVIDAPQDGHARLPMVATDASGHAVVTWARSSWNGTARGIYAVQLDGSQASIPSQRIDAGVVAGIEPTLAVAPSGEAVVAWLQLKQQRHTIQFRELEPADSGFDCGPVRTLPHSAPGYTSGLAAAISGTQTRIAFNHFGDGPKLESGLFLATFNANELTELRRITTASEGNQMVARNRGTTRLAQASDGALVAAWSGAGGLGDKSAVHLSWLGGTQGALNLAATPAIERTDDRFEEVASAAEPTHTPPTFDPERARRERSDDNPVGFAGLAGDFDFLGIQDTGWLPPDPHLAVGPNHVVCMTNGAIAFFDKAGNFQFQDEIEGGFGFWGAEGATGFVFDPEVIYDPHSDRFIAMANERGSDNRPYFLLAVSDDSDPNGSWAKYRIDVFNEINDTDIDSPNLGVDEDVIYLSADFFGPDKYLVYMIEKAPTLSGGAINATSLVIQGEQSIGIPVNYDTGTPAQYMIRGLEFQTASIVQLYAITGALTTPQVQSINLTVPTYDHPADPPQAGTSVRPELFEARFWSCVYRNGSLWATHHVDSTRARQRWYQIDMNGWPSGGTPTLVQSGEIDLGPDVWTYFGSIAVDQNDNMGMVFARSGTNEPISMARVTRLAGDPLGTTRPAVTVAVSTNPEFVNRWGDYSATVSDEFEADTFWGIHEYRTNGWNTRVARFASSDAPSTYCVAAPNSASAGGGQIGSLGTTSIAANDFQLTCSGLPSGQFGIYFYGLNQTQVAGGDGFICISSPVYRLPIQPVVAGGITLAVDYNNLPANPAAQISAGSTWNFQLWYRDPAAGGTTYNFSNGLNATFFP